MIKNELLNKIPYDVLINNIIPYTYIKKCPQHLKDIRSFYSHFSLVENYYYIYYNQHILLNDLERFFYKSDRIYVITNQYYKIFKRHIMFTPFLISNAHFIDIIIMKNKIYFIL